MDKKKKLWIKKALNEVKQMGLLGVYIDDANDARELKIPFVLTAYFDFDVQYFFAAKRKLTDTECDRALHLESLLDALLVELNGRKSKIKYATRTGYDFASARDEAETLGYEGRKKDGTE